MLASAFHLCLCLHSVLILHFRALSLKSYRNHATEISERFKDLARVDLAFIKQIVNFWRIRNGSLNLLGITSEESWFLISLKMLLKHAYMGWKFQRTLKLDISFSLEHFFISIVIFTQVVSAPLNHNSIRYFQNMVFLQKGSQPLAFLYWSIKAYLNRFLLKP